MVEDRRQQFEDLVWPHRAAVLRAALFLTRNPHDADDLAQEALLKALRSLERFTGGDVRAWLLAILRNAHIDRLRAAKLRGKPAALDEVAEPEAPPAPPPEADAADEARWRNPAALFEQFGDQDLIAALRTLPPDMAWTLLLVDVEGLDHADAAAILDTAVGTVKSRAHRARALLREKLYAVARERRWVTE